MLPLLRTRFPEVARAIWPLIVVATVLQLVFVRAPAALFLRFLAGSVLAVIGLLMLFVGVDLGIVPMGRFIGAELPKRGSLWLVLGVAAALGFATTAAEPDVLVLADQAELASGGTISSRSLVALIAAGVGLFSALGVLRIVRGFSMTTLLSASYIVVILLTLVAAEEVVPLAYDAGSVTTGVLTAPVVLAFAMGLASILSRRSVVSDGFGLLGLASIGPILVLLLLGWLA